MITDSLGEFFWKRVKFVLLFLFFGTILFIVSKYYIFEVPNTDNSELLSSIRGYEEVLDKQAESKEQIAKIFGQIKDMEFDIHQVQVQDEVTKRISQVRRIYKEYELNSKFKFSIISADLMVLYFDTKQAHSSLIKNKAQIEGNLMECKANF